MNLFNTEHNPATSNLSERCRELHVIMRILAELTTPDKVVLKILQTICENLELALGEYWIVDNKNNVLRNEEVWYKPSVNIPEYKKITSQIVFSPGVGLPGIVYTAKKPVWIQDIVHNTHFYHTKVATQEGFQGALGIPAIHEDNVMGVFVFLSYTSQPFNNDILMLLASTGRFIGLFITRRQAENVLHQKYKDLELKIKRRTSALIQANRRLQLKIAEHKQTENALKRRIDFEKTVASISTKFLITSDFNKAVFKALTDAGQLSNASRTYLFQFYDNGSIMDNTHEWCNEGVIPEIYHRHNIPAAMRPWLMENLHAGNIIHIADVSQMPQEAAAEKEEFEKEGIKAFLILPIYAENELVGFIGFDNVVTTGPWREEDIARLRIMAEITGNAISHKKAEALITHMAYHDPLTNLPNRNLFQDRLQVAIVHAKRMGTIMALMAIDLDNFKTINDSLGHYTGDLLLLAVVEQLKKCVRESDTIARTGGDEFLIILPEITYPLNAAIVANKILDALSKPFFLESHEIYTTVSIGISLYPLDTNDISSLIKNADVAMYLSKEQGKNTYRFYNSDMNTHV
ncbi:MAG: diguanylate cyclase [Candidatus Brocadia sp.]|uniref:Diguanylate cyclase/phosphodiesterase n=1 Tax=Candidatus Brocadia fulgida TaxID=380242 RepID=A0A0M2UQS6_9BACT|nr:MAG: diguanylate cyclase/phosphodiesterase [Candidatus Brocadia fulgida]OQY98770.1 MAG: hypothetical protein B6D35_11060 [Candidatus Brocadia sp. UTAMX2]UJS21174.1 MAG: diguanylate cyclase [Candidatus Brocadia sp.]